VSKIIVITGAGMGLGRALARRFAADGEQVVLLARTASTIEAAAAEIGDAAFAVACDVSSPDQVKAGFAKIAERYGRIDVLINNAAIFEPFLVAEATDAQIVNTISINLTGTILCARSAIPLMARGSHIINVSSESVELNYPHLSLYQATKAGIERFTHSLEQELDPQGIRVSYVRAGAMTDGEKTWNIDPAAGARFAKAAMEAGLNLLQRPISQYASVTQVFRALIDLPPDLHATSISLHARATAK
jgi:NAD(P)-dependent dehydrogenase (short-subunit alcohol dehydrogenase family)